ncbi:expressed unknown protein [Seminavis robusta]|uniref:Uncharacterized protein n=1 Tax=Seminavis robusta TaxID=568900 RepID=A0A9N8H5S1_9STRA|nr:expressed unknown protein [Seminavis robusta]|eukprot:Sro150_g068970.1 n/a (177) ;mRNA; f:92167-92697
MVHVKENVKLGFLLSSLLFCLGSLVTSHKSFQMGPRDLPTLQPNVKQFCRFVYKARDRCLDEKKRQDPSCPSIMTQASQCEGAVKLAYRSINTWGCSYQLRDQTLCELERCGGYHGVSVLRTNDAPKVMGANSEEFKEAVEGCANHCNTIRKRLDQCIQDNVHKVLKKQGIRVKED